MKKNSTSKVKSSYGLTTGIDSTDSSALRSEMISLGKRCSRTTRARIQPLAAASLYASIALTRILAWSTIGITYPSSLIFFSDNVADGLWTPVVQRPNDRGRKSAAPSVFSDPDGM